ncbi:MAG: SDR family NAD(P)-dependent oxidoreductase [Clostridia bacterium]|nr:SDR family NAD(P)-dependent oxidoreductase [Clostridia bacterium]MBQ7907877.1 SDR family NAD(P)-dependent oxidoreductase [Clostridia bacterium]
MKRFDYKDKVAIITGASSGIGKALAGELIKRYNCTVFAIARNEERLRLAKEELGDLYVPYPMDATSKEGWQELRDFLKKSDTPPDILINCAGVLPKFEPFLKSGSEKLLEVISINLMAGVYGCEAFMPIMNEGSIVINIASSSALCPFGLVSAYSASKAAFERFSEALACESTRISVTTALPGFVKTDIMRGQNPSQREKSLIDKFSADADKVAKKILAKARKRKRRTVIGFDAKLMDFMYKHFPNSAPKMISSFLKKSGLALFAQ